MQRIYTYLASAMLLAAGAIFFLTGCQKEKPEFLDLDLENITQMTEAQQQVFMKAVDRLDRHVTFEGDHYVLGSVSAEQLGLSLRLFEYLQKCMNGMNVNIQQMKS